MLQPSRTECANDPECQAKLARAADPACEAFQPPEYAVKGATPYDQRWANGNTEAGVGACGWPRPKPRPPELDGKTKPAPAAKPARPRAKISFRSRVKALVTPAAATPPPPEPPVTVVRTVPVVQAPPDPLDELIGARDGAVPAQPMKALR